MLTKPGARVIVVEPPSPNCVLPSFVLFFEVPLRMAEHSSLVKLLRVDSLTIHLLNWLGLLDNIGINRVYICLWWLRRTDSLLGGEFSNVNILIV